MTRRSWPWKLGTVSTSVWISKEDARRMNSDLPRTWIQPQTRATVENYDPLLVVRINLAKIRKYFR